MTEEPWPARPYDAWKDTYAADLAGWDRASLEKSPTEREERIAGGG